jgi:hypothetical protein
MQSIKYIGPRGGFRHLSYEYTNSDGVKVSTSNGFKQESERLIKLFEECDIPIETKVIA